MVGPGGSITEKVSAFELAPPELTTVTLTVRVAVIMPADTVALKSVALANVVGSGVPFHRMAAPLTKPVPLTFNAKAWPPASAEFGESSLIDGTEGPMMKL